MLKFVLNGYGHPPSPGPAPAACVQAHFLALRGRVPYLLREIVVPAVINALIKHAHKLPRELYKSLTWDRGKEMADHQRFSLATDVKVHFCDPQHPWQRGSNEQINGLLRQYFPKGMALSRIHQNRLNAVARRLNGRPRETLDFETPAERFEKCVASIN